MPQAATATPSAQADSSPPRSAGSSSRPSFTKKPLPGLPRSVTAQPNMCEREESGASSGDGASTISSARSPGARSGSTKRSKLARSDAS